MDRFLVTVLLLASVIGPMTCASQTSTNVPAPPEPHPITTDHTPNVTTSTSKPNTTTTKPPLTTTSVTSTTPPPTPKPTNGTTPTPSPKPTTPPSPKPSPTTTPAPHPSTTPSPPSDRKFEAFSFIGGFALAIGLVAIGFLAWKLYISRRENVYHTL